MKMTTLIIASLCAATFAFGTAQAADQKFGADRHVGMGLSCETCHGPDKANPQEPTIDTCKQCHDVKALVEKTKDVKPANPHMSPHYRDELATSCTARRKTSATSATSSATRFRNHPNRHAGSPTPSVRMLSSISPASPKASPPKALSGRSPEERFFLPRAHLHAS